MNACVLLNETVPVAAVQTTVDTANHPSVGILRGYLLRLMFTGTAASNVTPTYENWRDTILPTILPSVQLFAPRYSKQLMSANLDGGFFAKMYEDHYGEPISIEVANVPVTPAAGVQLTSGGQACQVDLFIPFELPKLGVDRLWSCPPCLLFRGDATIKYTWVAAVTVSAVVITTSAMTVRWFALTAYGNDATLPVLHRFERRTYAQNSIDVGRGFPVFITDNRAPDNATNAYNNFLDGVPVNNGAIYGEDLEAAYRITNLDIVPETSIYTPLFWVPNNSTPNTIEFAERSLAFQFVGPTSGTLDMHIMEPAGKAVLSAMKAALGIPNSVTVASPPVAPNGVALGNVVQKVAINGPRSILTQNGGSLVAPQVTAKTTPCVPAGTTGASIAGAMAGRASAK